MFIALFGIAVLNGVVLVNAINQKKQGGMLTQDAVFNGLRDEVNLSKNSAFSISDINIRNLYSKEFQSKSALHFGNQPKFFDIIERINNYLVKL